MMGLMEVQGVDVVQEVAAEELRGLLLLTPPPSTTTEPSADVADGEGAAAATDTVLAFQRNTWQK